MGERAMLWSFGALLLLGAWGWFCYWAGAQDWRMKQRIIKTIRERKR